MMRILVSIIPVLICAVMSAQVPQPVDMGLSVKWASFNLGASAPSEAGNYYAWGETSGKDVYTWNTYSLCRGDDHSFTSYCSDSRFGDVDNIRTLKSSDDAARTALGYPWRIPTVVEWVELWQNCDWEWVWQDGVPGCRAKSRVNGAVLFFPAAGHVQEYTPYDKGAFGYYWSSSAGEGYSYDVYDFFFYDGGMGVYYYARRFGFSIRPVL